MKNNPNLAVLLNDGESLADFLKLSPEEILLRWFNYHLDKAGHPRRVNNFGKDIMVRHSQGSCAGENAYALECLFSPGAYVGRRARERQNLQQYSTRRGDFDDEVV